MKLCNVFGIETSMPLSFNAIEIVIQSNSSTFFFPFSQYWEKAKFPFHVIPKLGALRIAGGTIKVICASFLPTPLPLFLEV